MISEGFGDKEIMEAFSIGIPLTSAIGIIAYYHAHQKRTEVRRSKKQTYVFENSYAVRKTTKKAASKKSRREFNYDIFVGNSLCKAREKVRIRDGHNCVDCGKKWRVGIRRFDVHHIEFKDGKSMGTFKDANYDRENTDKLVTLCKKCHGKRHSGINKYGLNAG